MGDKEFFKLHIHDAGMIYGTLYSHYGKKPSQQFLDSLEQKEIHLRGIKAKDAIDEAHRMMLPLMLKLRIWLIERMGEEAILELEEGIDQIQDV